MCERFDYCHIYALRKFQFWFLPRDAMHPQYYPWACVCLCLCLCLSVTSRSSTKTAKVGSRKQHRTIAREL